MRGKARRRRYALPSEGYAYHGGAAQTSRFAVAKSVVAESRDRESGDAYGILPFLKSLPIAMTDHIDRSPDERTLRGRIGTVHSWILADDEKIVSESGKRI